LKLYVLDTNIVSYAIRPKSPARAWLDSLPSSVQACISCITEAEMRYGVELSKSEGLRFAVEALLSRSMVLPWTSAETRAYARLRAENEAAGKGRDVGAFDWLIAAQAVAADARLITNDAALTKLKGVEVERWKL
jgi:tRNA(fMet)-specific endonuclease VapC